MEYSTVEYSTYALWNQVRHVPLPPRPPGCESRDQTCDEISESELNTQMQSNSFILVFCSTAFQYHTDCTVKHSLNTSDKGWKKKVWDRTGVVQQF